MPLQTADGGSSYNAAEERKKKRQQIMDDKNLNIWQKKHLLDQMDEADAKAKPEINLRTPGVPEVKPQTSGPTKLFGGLPGQEMKKEEPPKKAVVRNPFTYLDRPADEAEPEVQPVFDLGGAWNMMSHRPVSIVPKKPEPPKQQPAADPGSVDWLVGKGVPWEAAERIAGNSPSVFEPQPGTVDWLEEKGVPRQAAETFAREPDPIRPDQYYWKRKKVILDNPNMAPFMKQYVLSLLEDMYHTPMNRIPDPNKDSNAPLPDLTPTTVEVIDSVIRQNGEVTQKDMEDLGIGIGAGADIAAWIMNSSYSRSSDFGGSFQDMALQYALSQGDQGAAYTTWRMAQAGSSLLDRLLAGAPDQRLADRPMNLVDKGRGGGDNKNGNTKPVGASGQPPDGGSGNATTPRYSGRLVKVNNPDSAADALGKRIGGQSRVKFENDPSGKEFDAVSDEYIAETKPALKRYNNDIRTQMKRVFEAAKETGRSVYYHFEGQPGQEVIRKLHEYSQRYGVTVVIDTEPLFR